MKFFNKVRPRFVNFLFLIIVKSMVLGGLFLILKNQNITFYNGRVFFHGGFFLGLILFVLGAIGTYIVLTNLATVLKRRKMIKSKLENKNQHNVKNYEPIKINPGGAVCGLICPMCGAIGKCSWSIPTGDLILFDVYNFSCSSCGYSQNKTRFNGSFVGSDVSDDKNWQTKCPFCGVSCCEHICKGDDINLYFKDKKDKKIAERILA